MLISNKLKYSNSYLLSWVFDSHLLVMFILAGGFELLPLPPMAPVPPPLPPPPPAPPPLVPPPLLLPPLTALPTATTTAALLAPTVPVLTTVFPAVTGVAPVEETADEMLLLFVIPETLLTTVVPDVDVTEELLQLLFPARSLLLLPTDTTVPPADVLIVVV